MKQKYYYDGYNENDKTIFDFPGFNENPKKADKQKLNKFIKEQKANIYTPIEITFFHGSSIMDFEKILDKGILPTTKKNRNSYQSSSGFVYLTPYLYIAQIFGNYAAHWRQHSSFNNEKANSIIYKIDVSITNLSPDRDQIINKNKNKLEHEQPLSFNFAESLIEGKSIRNKGMIYLSSIKSVIVYDIEEDKNKEIEFNLSSLDRVKDEVNQIIKKNKDFEKKIKKSYPNDLAI